MSTAKITLTGFEMYLNKEDRSLFDDIKLPSGISKSDLTDTIFLASADYEVLYSDPYFMQEAIQRWFRTHYWTIDKWIKAINIKYEPLMNYDRTEEWTDDHEGEDSKNTSSKYSNKGSSKTEDTTSGKTTNNLTSETSYGKETTTTNTVASYDSSSFENREKSVTSDSGKDTTKDTGSVTTSGSGKVEGSTSDSGTGSSEETGKDKYKNTHKGRMYGNIGVTTSQAMLESELEVARFNIYEQISDMFISDFLILVA